MKKIFLIFIFLGTYLFAITPYSLEGFKEANIKVLYKGDLLSKDFKKYLKKDIVKELQKLGIQTKSKYYSNFVAKIQIVKINKKHVLNCEIFIVEDVNPIRDKKSQIMAITYKKNDFFETDEKLENAVYESVVEYLLSDIIEQYKDENN